MQYESQTYLNIGNENRIRENRIIKRDCAVVIPALNPMPNLPQFVQELLRRGISQIIVVNDGSDSSFDNVFREIGQMERCTLLTHPYNCGKGRALKTAFSYFTKHFSALDGVVTADADGQHGIEDICNICEGLSKKERTLVLGVRDLKDQNVPKRSYLGNTLCSNIFCLLYKRYLKDTQTGLRGIPTEMLLWMTEIKGERYEYEINMLIQTKRRNIDFTETPIKTLYFDNNSGSHFNTVKDTARIFHILVSGLIQFSPSSTFSG